MTLRAIPTATTEKAGHPPAFFFARKGGDQLTGLQLTPCIFRGNAMRPAVLDRDCSFVNIPQ